MTYPKLILSCVSLALLVTGCGGGAGGSGSNSSANDGSYNTGDGSNDSAGNSIRYLSDIHDAYVSPCQNGQVFAFEQCWDSIDFNDAGDFSLTNQEKTLVLFKGGVVTASETSKFYQYSTGSSGYDDSSMEMFLACYGNARTKYMIPPGYWLLPETIKTTNKLQTYISQGQDLISANLNLINFYSEKTNWFVHGTATICGKKFDLPLLQKDVEDACGVHHGDAWSAKVRMPNNLWMTFTYTDRGMDQKDKGVVRERRVYEVQFDYQK